MEICSGGIIGMGESKEDVVDMLFDLKEITSILNAASKVMSMMLAILLCTMAMMTISTVVVLMMGGAVQ